MSAKTISILICAYNEEKNIGLVLKDLRAIELTSSFKLENIFVVSDGSVDSTEKIVTDEQRFNEKVRLVRNEKRMGKMQSLEKMFLEINEDILISLDADIRIETSAIQHLVAPFLKDDATLLSGGNPVPIERSNDLNATRLAATFSWRLLDSIKQKYPNSIYSAHGRILALKRDLYKRLISLSSNAVGTDQVMYLASGGNFSYVPHSIVYYALPATAKDYIKQNKRFRLARNARVREGSSTNKTFLVPDKMSLFLGNFFKHPVEGSVWLILYLLGMAVFSITILSGKKQTIENVWGEVGSSKNVN